MTAREFCDFVYHVLVEQTRVVDPRVQEARFDVRGDLDEDLGMNAPLALSDPAREAAIRALSG